jgi:hypothetical protein
VAYRRPSPQRRIIMEEHAGERLPEDASGSTGRRTALAAMGAAGMALLAALGLADGGEAKGHTHTGAKRRHTANR